MNVREVVEIIMALNGGRKFEKTSDQLIEGNWEYQVTGVATTFMATVDVIRRAIAMSCNLIITHEPTYFNHLDHIEWAKTDPVYQRKKDLIADNQISIWRYHDHIHFGHEDLIYEGLLKELGWINYRDLEFPSPHCYTILIYEGLLKELGYRDLEFPLPLCYTIPPTTVVALAGFLKKTLGMKVIQIVGDSEMKCSRIGILVGGGSLGIPHEEMPAKLMYDQQLDVMICGEITEWTLSAYVRDATALGFNKAMIVVGHERSEESGMKELANRLRPLLKGTPVHFADAGEPFIYL